MLESDILWISWGRLFQALGPAWENSVRQTSPELLVVHNGESWQIWLRVGKAKGREGKECTREGAQKELEDIPAV